MTTAAWQVIAASAVGAAHTDGVNQDAFAHRVLGPGSVVAAVADGHGGRHYVRSAAGARLAVDLTVGIVAENPAAAATDLPGLCRELVRRWRTAVLADLAAHPFTAAERAKAGRDPDAQPLLAYGATLLFVVVHGRRALLAQLGDGDVVVSAGGRLVGNAVPGDDRLAAGMTTSLGGETAAADFRFGVVDGIDQVLLASDGYGNSFADPQWRPQVLTDLRKAIQAHGLAAVQREFSGWLRESAQAGGDDVTAVVIVDPGAMPPAVADTAAAAPRSAGPDADRTMITRGPILAPPGSAVPTGSSTVLTPGPPRVTGPPAGAPAAGFGGSAGGPAGPTAVSSAPPMSGPPARARGRTGWWVLGVLAALLVGGGVAWWLASGPLAPEPVVQQVIQQVPVTVTAPAVTVDVTVTELSTTVATTTSVTTETVTSSTETSGSPETTPVPGGIPASGADGAPPGEAGAVTSATATTTEPGGSGP